MLRSLYSAVSGMNAYQTSLDVVGNNIANVDTTGFKSGRVEFSDILSQTVSGASSPTANLGGINAQQVGLGVNISAVQNSFTQGADQVTGVPTDIALNGDGFFVVSPQGQLASSTGTPPANSSTVPLYYSRAGNFSVDGAGNLVLPDGSKLMGQFVPANGGTPGPAPTSFSSTNLSAVNLGMPASASGGTNVLLNNYTIGQNGQITLTDPNTGTIVGTYYVPVARVTNPAGMTKVGANLYTTGVNSGGGTIPPLYTPGQNGAASFQSGALEASNVNLTDQFTAMIIAQQAFDANSKVINTDNNILSTVLNLEQQA
ncbi:flagellar hook-basal body complex protein [Ferroacidibacillus organovorans]|uniref:Uncharacterized protein n=1 Tax=Ferroacidibacillus organovorans TaxID=1765683 RepID=A0A101XP87_9BACL|nr:flagellar hook-basal body complex protein [Ferroacidibacillus organovorans]KUO95063.1 hypothetical protein ATW55_11340 [Ferroacidibacillus organovorans]